MGFHQYKSGANETKPTQVEFKRLGLRSSIDIKMNRGQALWLPGNKDLQMLKKFARTIINCTNLKLYYGFTQNHVRYSWAGMTFIS